MPITRRTLVSAMALVTFFASLAPVADACTRILWNTNKLAVLAGRTMDFPISTEPVITVLPRGMARDGGMFAGAHIDAVNPARWTSKYGSIVTSVFGAGTADGVNEKGVAMHLLYFIPADFGPRDPKKGGLQAALWVAGAGGWPQWPMRKSDVRQVLKTCRTSYVSDWTATDPGCVKRPARL